MDITLDYQVGCVETVFMTRLRLTYGACPGHTIDHVKALACGGSDTPENMQYQMNEEAKEKDRWERIGCK